MTLTTHRTIRATNGTDTCELAILTDGRSYWLHDPQHDPHADSLTELEDDSDTAVQDALTGDWAYVNEIEPDDTYDRLANMHPPSEHFPYADADEAAEWGESE